MGDVQGTVLRQILSRDLDSALFCTMYTMYFCSIVAGQVHWSLSYCLLSVSLLCRRAVVASALVEVFGWGWMEEEGLSDRPGTVDGLGLGGGYTHCHPKGGNRYVPPGTGRVFHLCHFDPILRVQYNVCTVTLWWCHYASRSRVGAREKFPFPLMP